MAFFGNRAVNRVNLHYAIQAFAEAAGGLFVLVFMLRAGLSVPQALLTQAAVLACRFALRPVVLPLAKRFGLKPLLIFGTLVCAASYPILSQVQGVGLPLVLYVVVGSVGALFYWTTYHAYFAALGDAEHRGHQISAREALVAVIGIIAPIAGGAALATVGGQATFAAVGLIHALAAVPLFGAPAVAVAASAPGAWRAARLGWALFASEGWGAASQHWIWQIALFGALAQSYTAYGGAMALAALVGAVVGLFFGRFIDGGGGRRAVVLAYAVNAGVVLLRAASPDWPVLAVTANALGALVVALVVPAIMTPVYNLAKASPCPLRFHIISESGWDAGCICGALAGAGIAALGLPLSWAMLTALPAMAVGAGLLWRQYGKAEAVAVA